MHTEHKTEVTPPSHFGLVMDVRRAIKIKKILFLAFGRKWGRRGCWKFCQKSKIAQPLPEKKFLARCIINIQTAQPLPRE